MARLHKTAREWLFDDLYLSFNNFAYEIAEIFYAAVVKSFPSNVTPSAGGI
jgi:hypothetical protein